MFSWKRFVLSSIFLLGFLCITKPAFAATVFGEVQPLPAWQQTLVSLYLRYVPGNKSSELVLSQMVLSLSKHQAGELKGNAKVVLKAQDNSITTVLGEANGRYEKNGTDLFAKLDWEGSGLFEGTNIWILGQFWSAPTQWLVKLRDTSVFFGSDALIPALQKNWWQLPVLKLDPDSQARFLTLLNQSELSPAELTNVGDRPAYQVKLHWSSEQLTAWWQEELGGEEIKVEPVDAVLLIDRETMLPISLAFPLRLQFTFPVQKTLVTQTAVQKVQHALQKANSAQLEVSLNWMPAQESPSLQLEKLPEAREWLELKKMATRSAVLGVSSRPTELTPLTPWQQWMLNHQNTALKVKSATRSATPSPKLE